MYMTLNIERAFFVKKLSEYLFLWSLGGILYYTFELLFRGFSHWSMFALGGICLVAGLGGKDHRDGSLAYYFSEPVVCNDAKGVGPLVLAYTEMIAKK